MINLIRKYFIFYILIVLFCYTIVLNATTCQNGYNLYTNDNDILCCQQTASGSTIDVCSFNVECEQQILNAINDCLLLNFQDCMCNIYNNLPSNCFYDQNAQNMLLCGVLPADKSYPIAVHYGESGSNLCIRLDYISCSDIQFYPGQNNQECDNNTCYHKVTLTCGDNWLIEYMPDDSNCHVYSFSNVNDDELSQYQIQEYQEDPFFQYCTNQNLQVEFEVESKCYKKDDIPLCIGDYCGGNPDGDNQSYDNITPSVIDPLVPVPDEIQGQDLSTIIEQLNQVNKQLYSINKNIIDAKNKLGNNNIDNTEIKEKLQEIKQEIINSSNKLTNAIDNSTQQIINKMHEIVGNGEVTSLTTSDFDTSINIDGLQQYDNYDFNQTTGFIEQLPIFSAFRNTKIQTTNEQCQITGEVFNHSFTIDFCQQTVVNLLDTMGAIILGISSILFFIIIFSA